MFEILKSKLCRNPIEDIVTVGFVDLSDAILKYYPRLKWIYFEFANFFMEFESIEQYSKLRVKFAESITVQGDLEDGMRETISSVIDIVLTGGEMACGKDVKRMIFFNLICSGEAFICDALKIILTNDQILFLDPTFVHGISFGGASQEQCWKENFTSNYTSMDIEISS
jgi:hypothetical protein